MHVVIVGSRQDLIAFAQRESVVEKRQAGCRVLSKRDVLCVAANITGDGTTNLQRNGLVSLFEKRAVHGNKRVRINSCPVLLYCLTHSPRMRRQEE